MLTREQIRTGVNEIREMAGEIRLKLHLATMDARSYWEKLEPELGKLERTLEEKGSEAIETAGELFQRVGAAVRKFRDELFDDSSPRPSD